MNHRDRRLANRCRRHCGRRVIAGLVAGLAAGLAGGCSPPALTPAPPGSPARDNGLCDRDPPPAADLHVDVVYRAHYRRRPLALDLPGSAVTSAGLRAGRVRMLVLSLYLSSGLRRPRHTIDDFDALLATGEQLVRANPHLFAGKDAIRHLFSVEGSHALAGHEDRLPAYLARGVRLFGLVHSLHNQLADSATDRRRGHGGLSPAGERFVRAVYRAGGLIDVAHASDATFADVARLARAAGRPIIASHAGARAITDHPRNLTDAQLRTIADSGGLVGVLFHSPLLRPKPSPLRRDKKTASIADLHVHIEHLIAVMGVRHVAIGSDLDGGIRPVALLEDHHALPRLSCALNKKGLPPDEVQALYHDNAKRVLGPYLTPVAPASAAP